MKGKIIQSFTIKGLFGLYDVHIPFENDVMILIGENGMGKTQIMNLLYYMLSKDFINLDQSDFAEFYIKFENHEELKFDNLFNYNNNPVALKTYLFEYLQGCEILYLPTYRRIEQSWKKLAHKPTKYPLLNPDLSTNFWEMDDVQKTFDRITQAIKNLSRDGLSKMLSEVLINGNSKIGRNFLENIGENDIDIILARVGNDIDSKAKKEVRRIASTKKIQEKDKSLLYFLQKLVEVYNLQRPLDDSVRRFKDVCNKYLVNKTLVYDEKRTDIYVKINQDNEPIDLNKLSFGEKQIISIFSKIYLSSPDSEFVVLIDEPELSLSIFWQRELLPDIYNSGKVRLLFAVTHSPFIFENELDKYAISLNEYMKPTTLDLASLADVL